MPKIVEFTRFYGDPIDNGEPINYAAASGLKESGAEGDGNGGRISQSS